MLSDAQMLYLSCSYCWHFNINEHAKFHAQFSWAQKLLYNFGFRSAPFFCSLATKSSLFTSRLKYSLWISSNSCFHLWYSFCVFFFFFCLLWYFTSHSTIFQLCQDGSSWVEPVLSKHKCVLLKDTTQWGQWGSNQRPLGLESSTLPLSHCAPHSVCR